MPPVKKKPGRPKGSKNKEKDRTKDVLPEPPFNDIALIEALVGTPDYLRPASVENMEAILAELKRGFSMIRRALELNGYQVPPEEE